MGKRTKCKSGSHQVFKDRVKNRLEDLQEMFTGLQSARKESGSINVAVLEEQVNQMLKEWKNELNEPSPASSLQQGGSLRSFSPDISRLLQLCDEEDDATSGLAALKPNPDGHKAAAFHESMAPRKEPTKRAPPVSRGRGGSEDAPPDFSQMISDQISAAMPNIISQLSASIMQNLGGTDNGTRSGTGGPRADAGDAGGSRAGNGGTIVIEDNPRGCSYKTFMGCKPHDFKGTEGAVGILRWIEKTESVLDVSGCADNNKVKYATCTFQGKTLTWWNTEVRTRGRAAINAMTWEQLKEILITKYCPRNEIQKIETEFWELTMKEADHQGYTNRFHELSQFVPHMVTPETKRIDRYIWGLAPQIRCMVISARPNTLQSAIVLAGTLTDEMVRVGSLVKFEPRYRPGNKRKRHANNSDSRKMANQGNERKQQSVQSYATVVSDKKQNGGPHPKCDKCNFHHVGPCLFCSKCKKNGHSESYCKFGSCFECGSLEHYKNNCPRLKQSAGNAANPPRGRAYAMGIPEARQDPNVVSGN